MATHPSAITKLLLPPRYVPSSRENSSSHLIFSSSMGERNSTSPRTPRSAHQRPAIPNAPAPTTATHSVKESTAFRPRGNHQATITHASAPDTRNPMDAVRSLACFMSFVAQLCLRRLSDGKSKYGCGFAARKGRKTGHVSQAILTLGRHTGCAVSASPGNQALDRLCGVVSPVAFTSFRCHGSGQKTATPQPASSGRRRAMRLSSGYNWASHPSPRLRAAG